MLEHMDEFILSLVINQDFTFWNNMGKHNLVLWLDYTEEATSYHTLDMSMWGAVRYRRTFSYDDCNMVQSIAIDHKHLHHIQDKDT